MISHELPVRRRVARSEESWIGPAREMAVAAESALVSPLLRNYLSRFTRLSNGGGGSQDGAAEGSNLSHAQAAVATESAAESAAESASAAERLRQPNAGSLQTLL